MLNCVKIWLVFSPISFLRRYLKRYLRPLHFLLLSFTTLSSSTHQMCYPNNRSFLVSLECDSVSAFVNWLCRKRGVEWVSVEVSVYARGIGFVLVTSLFARLLNSYKSAPIEQLYSKNCKSFW